MQVNEDDDVLPKFVCTDCWSKSNRFHNFYNAVAEAKQIFLVNLVKVEEPEIFEIDRDPYADEVFNDPLLKIEPTGPGDKTCNAESADIGYGFESLKDYGFDGYSVALDTATDGNNESVEVKCEVLVGQKSTLIVDPSLDNVQKAKTTSVLAKECSSTFKDVQNLRKHLPQHNTLSTKLQCPQCPKKLLNRQKLVKHISNWHKMHKCHFCGREFTRSDQLKVCSFIHI